MAQFGTEVLWLVRSMIWIQCGLVLILLILSGPARGLNDATFSVGAVFDSSQMPKLGEIFDKIICEVNASSPYDLSWIPIPTNRTTENSLEDMCEVLENSSVVSLISITSPVETSFSAALIGGHLGVPVVGYFNGYYDYMFKDISSLYLGLNPSLFHLAQTIINILQHNKWAFMSVIMDDSFASMHFRSQLDSLAKTSSIIWTNKDDALISSHVDDNEIRSKLIALRENQSRIIILHTDQHLAIKIFRQAQFLNFLLKGWIWILTEKAFSTNADPLNFYPTGILAVKLSSPNYEEIIKIAINVFAQGLSNLNPGLVAEGAIISGKRNWSCWMNKDGNISNFSKLLYREMNKIVDRILLGRQTFDGGGKPYRAIVRFNIVNLVQIKSGKKVWKSIGRVVGDYVSLNTVIWPGNTTMSIPPGGRKKLRVVTTFAPPFVMQAESFPSGHCLEGVICLNVSSSDKLMLTKIFSDFEAGIHGNNTYEVLCCKGITVVLLDRLSQDIGFDYNLYLVPDGKFGSKKKGKWDGMVADLINGAAHMAIGPFSSDYERLRVIDFSHPYFYSGFSIIVSTKMRKVTLSAFLEPFTIKLWIAIIGAIHATAIAAAIFEWLSPFGLNPWGRQRTKNFSMASALTSVWSLFFNHTVNFKAPKSWPNKVLMNFWGAFCFVVLASYTANHAAIFAGLNYRAASLDLHDIELLNMKVATVRSSSAESYISRTNPHLNHHMQKYNVPNVDVGVQLLREGKLDVLISDTPILDYKRSIEPGCLLIPAGEPFGQENYGIALQKDSWLTASVSSMILRYMEKGYLDNQRFEFYGICIHSKWEDRVFPEALSFQHFIGVFIMLGVGAAVGILILILEHYVFRCIVPYLRKKPRKSKWRSPNLMFLSQKLYRFVNCVELVSPNHAAKEMVATLKQGQFASLFQKSVKRKAKEQAKRKRRKTAEHFFETVQEITRLQRQSSQTADESDDDRKAMVNGAIRMQELGEAGNIAVVIATPNTIPTEESAESSDWLAEFNDEMSDSSSPLSDDNRSRIYPDIHSDILCNNNLICSQPTPSDPIKSNSLQSLKYNPINNQPFLIDCLPLQSTSIAEIQVKPKVQSLPDDLKNYASSLPMTLKNIPCKDNRLRYNLCRPLTPDKIESMKRPLLDQEIQLQDLSKEQLLLMWKSAECDLRKQLHQALQEKAELEQRLAKVQFNLTQNGNKT